MWEYKDAMKYDREKYVWVMVSLLWDSILQGIVRCMFMAMAATWKVLRRTQEDEAHMGKRMWSFSCLNGL